jgi:hypothetical protein
LARRSPGTSHPVPEEGGTVYIGVGTIVAILLLIVLIAFVF